MKKQEQIRGIVEDITYHKTENGFTVMSMSVDGEELTVVGQLVEPSCGEELIGTGFYTPHPTYGRPFKDEIFERILPSNASAILRYLSGRAI